MNEADITRQWTVQDNGYPLEQCGEEQGASSRSHTGLCSVLTHETHVQAEKSDSTLHTAGKAKKSTFSIARLSDGRLSQSFSATLSPPGQALDNTLSVEDKTEDGVMNSSSTQANVDQIEGRMLDVIHHSGEHIPPQTYSVHRKDGASSPTPISEKDNISSVLVSTPTETVQEEALHYHQASNQHPKNYNRYNNMRIDNEQLPTGGCVLSQVNRVCPRPELQSQNTRQYSEIRVPADLARPRPSMTK